MSEWEQPFQAEGMANSRHRAPVGVHRVVGPNDRVGGRNTGDGSRVWRGPKAGLGLGSERTPCGGRVGLSLRVREV